MPVTFERLTPKPDSGRPARCKLSTNEGSVAVHYERDTGALWLFGEGPAGGDRGAVVFPPRQAEAVTAWLAGRCRDNSPSTTGRLRFSFGGRLEFRGGRWGREPQRAAPRSLDLSVGNGPERAAFEAELAAWAKQAAKPPPSRAARPACLGYLAEMDHGNYRLSAAAPTEAEARACLREEWATIPDQDKPGSAPADFDDYFEYVGGSVRALREGVVEWL